MIILRLFVLFLLLAVATARARLGENEIQSETRYGAATPELSSPGDKPLLPGAKEIIYNFAGYRVRAAFVNNITVRIEYANLPENGALKPLLDPEIKAILEGEKAGFSWKEEKPRTGNKEFDAFQTLVQGRKWERTDHALAVMKLNLLLQLETRDAAAIEKRLSKTQPAAIKPGAVPKF